MSAPSNYSLNPHFLEDEDQDNSSAFDTTTDDGRQTITMALNATRQDSELSDATQPDVTETMRISKQRLLKEVEEEEKARSCPSTFKTILTYLRADQSKRPTAVNIGIFTVFILVMVITWFKSVIDTSPILFVKVGQQQVGAVDFQIMAKNGTSLVSADVNYYAIDPWNNPFIVINDTETDDDDPIVIEEDELKLCPPLFEGETVIRKCDDHLVIAGSSFPIIRVSYYNERLTGLTGFSGFVPRWYIPHVQFAFDRFDYPVTLTLMIMDTVKENNLGIGWDWSPFRLGKGEIMIEQLVLEYVGGRIGDQVSIPIDLSPYFGDQAIAKLLALMVFEIDGMEVSLDRQELSYYGQDVVPLSALGISDDAYTLDLLYTVKQTYDEPDGKFSLVFSNAAIMDCNWVFPELLDSIVAKADLIKEVDPDLYDKIINYITKIDDWLDDKGVTFCNFAFDIEGVLENQSDYYLADYDDIKAGLMPPAQEIVDALTLQANYTMATPLLTQFKLTSLVHDFLDSTFLTTIFFLALLASILVISLMLADADGKTYEYGMLRALGFMKRHVMLMITLQSFSFALPGLFFGVIVAFILNTALRELIFILSSNAMDYRLTTMALSLGIAFGFLMPFLANYLPIKSALDKTLRNSLDLNKRQDDKFGVKVQRLEDLGMSVNQFVASIVLVSIGFMTYYFIPLAYVNQNFALVFLLLSIILLMLVVGMVFLCTLLFTYLERLLLWVGINTICRCDKRLHKVISKNMEGHSKRNFSTSIMFTLATAFLILSSSSFKVIAEVVNDLGMQLVGADVAAYSPNSLMNEGPMRTFLEAQMARESQPVLDFHFGTATYGTVQHFSDSDTGTYIRDINDVYDWNSGLTVQGCGKNLFNVTGTEFFLYDDIQSGIELDDVDGKPDAVQLLYTDEGVEQYVTYPTDDQNGYQTITNIHNKNITGTTDTIKIFVPTGGKLGFDVPTGGMVWLNRDVRATVRAYVTKMPFYYFSGYPTVTYVGPNLLTSYDDFMLLCQANIWKEDPKTGKTEAYDTWKAATAKYTWTDDVPKSNILVKLNPEITALEREFILNGIRGNLERTDVVIDKAEILDSLSTIDLVFNIFVAIVGLIAFFIAFFLLLIAMTQNINDAIWEYGVLRSMGLTKNEGRRVYMYEAFIIVVSSSIFGTVVGSATGILICGQFFTFIEMPLKIFFPTYMFTGMIVMALVTTYLAVYYPMKNVNQRQIATVLKSGS